MEWLTTSCLAKRSGVHLETVRYYERQGLLPRPPRTAAGYRQFSPDSVRRIRFIKRAQDLGFSLSEIGDLLGIRIEFRGDCSHVRKATMAKLSEIETKIEMLEAMRRALHKLVKGCPGRGSSAKCSILESIDVESASGEIDRKEVKANGFPAR